MVIVTFFAVSSAAYADDADKLIDDFYMGLALVIEQNTNSPDRCVQAVNSYYDRKRQTVLRIQRLTEESINNAMSRMKGQGDISDMDFNNEQAMKDLEEHAAPQMQSAQRMAPGVMRYTNAVKEFAAKYPMQAMKISMKAMELLPKVE